MLSAYSLIYHGLILVAWSLSINLCLRGQKKYVPLCVLMGLTLAIELVAQGLIEAGIEFVWLYHIFVIFEYALLCLYFLNMTAPGYRRLIKYSIPLFAMVSGAVSYRLYDFASFPGVNINTEGFLICTISTYVLFNLDIHKYHTIRKHPDFWISCGLLVFFAGTFFSNGLYTYLLALDRAQALQLFAYVNKPLNIILYSCIIIGFLCSVPQRSSIRSF